MNIRGKLILSIGLPLLATYLGLLAWDYHRQRTAALEQAQQTALERAEAAAAQIDGRLSSVAQIASAAGTLLENPDNRDPQRARAILQGTLRNPWVSSAHITVLPRSGDSPVTLTAERGQRRLAVQTISAPSDVPAKPAWSPPHTDPDTDGPGTRRVCTYTVPILSASDDKPAGLISLTVRLDDLRQLRGRPPVRDFPSRLLSDGLPARTNTPTTNPAADLADPPLPPPDASPAHRLEQFAIFDAAGHIVLTANPAGAADIPPDHSFFDVATRLHQPEMTAAARDALTGHARVVRVAGLHHAVPVVPPDSYHWLAIAPVHATGWFLASAIPESTAMAPILERLWQRAALLAAGLLVLLLVVLAVSFRISRPIESLASAVDRLAAGDLDSQVANPTGSRDELARLADGFNHMTRQLKSHVDALTRETAAREKVESEMRIARQIQTDLLPRTFPPFPDRPEFDLFAVNLPARRVAGDFYDFFFTPAGLLTLVVADVSGKGVPAAMLMAVTRTIVRNLAQTGLSPADIARRANTLLLADTSPSMFVTLFLAQYDPATGHLAYVNAGHPPPVRLRPGQPPVTCCTAQSPLLAAADEADIGPFEQHDEHLAPGDTLLLYTDGVTESMNPAGTLLATEGLTRLLTPLTTLPPDTLCHSLSTSLASYRSAPDPQDDITLLALRRSASP